MNLLEVHITEIISEKEITHPELGQLMEVVIETSCYGRTDVTKQWFTPDEWEKTKEKGYYMG